MKIRFVFLLTLSAILVHCVNEKDSIEDSVLSFPFSGEYYNWTNFEVKQLNFRIAGNKILIDTTYDLKVQDFRAHYVESVEDYPEITKFLGKPAAELRALKNRMVKFQCNFNVFWIQVENETKLDQIKFEGTDDCVVNQGTLMLVYSEMTKLKEKYYPRP